MRCRRRGSKAKRESISSGMGKMEVEVKGKMNGLESLAVAISTSMDVSRGKRSYTREVCLSMGTTSTSGPSVGISGGRPFLFLMTHLKYSKNVSKPASRSPLEGFDDGVRSIRILWSRNGRPNCKLFLTRI